MKSRWVQLVVLVTSVFALSAFQASRTPSGVRQLTSGPVAELAARCSPDGKWIVFQKYTSADPVSPELWLLAIDATFDTAKPLVPMKASGADWSPDGQWVSFRTSLGRENQVWKVRVHTGELRRLTNFEPGTAIGSTAWSSEDKIAFVANGQIEIIDPLGGHKLQSIRLPHSAVENDIAFSPNGRLLAVTSDNGTDGDIWLVDVEKRAAKQITVGADHDSGPSWLQNGKLLFSRQNGEHLHRQSRRHRSAQDHLRCARPVPGCCAA